MDYRRLDNQLAQLTLFLGAQYRDPDGDAAVLADYHLFGDEARKRRDVDVRELTWEEATSLGGFLSGHRSLG